MTELRRAVLAFLVGVLAFLLGAPAWAAFGLAANILVPRRRG